MNIERWLDGEPPGESETVIAALDVLRDYRNLLRDLRQDALDGEWQPNHGGLESIAESIARCDLLIEELDEWCLNVSLDGLIKVKRD